MTRNDLLTFLDLTEDVADSILDWVDSDEDVRELGAESGFYMRNKAFRYVPRNAPLRSLQEVAGEAVVADPGVHGPGAHRRVTRAPTPTFRRVRYPSGTSSAA